MSISAKRIKELERAEAKLQALESGGVDNWDFYDDALEGYYAENELEENRESLINDLEIVFGECAYEPSERGGGVAFNDEAFADAMKVLVEHGVTFETKGDK